MKAATLLSGIMLSSIACAGDEIATNSEKYIVQFTDQGIVDYDGKIEGLAATAPSKPNTALSFDSKAVKAYEAWLMNQRQTYFKAIAATLGHSIKPSHTYNVLQHGIALNLSKDDAYTLRKMPFVRSVWHAKNQVLYMNSTPQFVGADWIWNGSSTISGIGTQGRGITVGVIDTGVNDNHPFFRPMGPECGFSSPMPKVILKNCRYEGCPTGDDVDASCLYDPTALARDCVGHGSHVAGIVAGNAVMQSNGRLYQGIAKCASLISYNVGAGSLLNPSIDSTAVADAVEQAVRDGVQVVNMSFGPSTAAGANPWDPTDLPILSLRLQQVGILPVTAAGNLDEAYYPGVVLSAVGEVRHIAPWELVVGAANGGFATSLGWRPGWAMPDLIAGFSLLGPARNMPGITKPDLVAPGVNIESANSAGSGFIAASGTSMAAPVVAGGAALLKSANPSWTPMEIQSALMLTAQYTGTMNDRTLSPPYRPWTADEAGAGRIALNDAGLAGFVMDETYEHFINADPARGGNPAALNLPYVRDLPCAPLTCLWTPTSRWTRTIKATRPERINWNVSVDSPPGVTITVTPSTFVLSNATTADATVELTITATRTTPSVGQTRYGMIWFDPYPSPPFAVPAAHMTVSLED